MTDQPRRGPWAALPFDAVTFIAATFVRGADAARRAHQPDAADALDRLAALAADELRARGRTPDEQ